MIGINNICAYLFVIGCFNKRVVSDDIYFDKDSVRDTVQIKIDSGILQGNTKTLRNGRSYYNFQGIPYAVPPLGDLRFKNPVPFNKWNGILNATVPGPTCVEIMLRQISYSVSGQEDCLYLNVYTPKNPHTSNVFLPVLFWIYGGSFREGNSNIYVPDYLMKLDVIVVTFNYRVGVFGFLSTQDSVAPGNYGMKDMVLALKWVKKNIDKFGGDPNKITIAGESAGAAAVGYFLLSIQTKNLFHGAIMQSGSPLCSWALHRNARKLAFDLGLSLGITTNSSSTLIKYLRNVDLPNARRSLINVNLLNFAQSFNNGGPFAPVLEANSETAFLSKDSYKAFKNGDFHQVPVLIGINSQESKLFTSLLSLTRQLFFLYDVSPSSLVRTTMNIKSIKDSRIVGTKIKQYYLKSGSFVSGSDRELAEYFSDDLFNRPVIRTVQLLSRHVPTYFYVFDVEENIGRNWLKFIAEENGHVKGVAHATELWYLWKAGWTNTELISDLEKITSERLVKLWTNFVTYQNPTLYAEKQFDEVQWPAVKGPNVVYFYIGKSIKTGKNFRQNNLNFWNNLYANYSKGPFETY